MSARSALLANVVANAVALGAAAFVVVGAAVAHAGPPPRDVVEPTGSGVARVVSADAAGPWLEPGDSLPTGARVVRVLRADESVMSGPNGASPRRGSLAKDARLPLFGSRAGPGCRGRWLSVGPTAWVCSEHVELTRGAPIPASAMTHPPSSDGLPYRYYFVGPDGSYGYRKLRELEIGSPDMQLDAGFAVAIAEERAIDGATYGHSGADLWIPMRDLAPARPLAFEGAVLDGTPRTSIPFAWVVVKEATLYEGPDLRRKSKDSIPQFFRVDVLGESSRGEPMLQIGEGRWLRAKDVRRPTMAPPPAEVDLEAHERWIDVDLETQTLLAYEGDRPVFATILSSGKGRPGSGNETRRGTFRIWAKLDTAHMDNLEQENANRYYRMENVPWVQFFDKGIGLHGAYWHRSFGHVRSHGCINLAPLDAQRLFSFTSPRLPAGWTAVLPRDAERGSLVRVR